MRIPLRLILTAVVATLVLGCTAISAVADTYNDDFAAAQELSGNRGMTYFDLSTATHETGEPLAGDPGDISAWFKYSPTENGLATFSTCIIDADTEMSGHSISVFSGATLTSLTNATTSTGGCKNGRVNATTAPLAVSAGTDYWIQLEISATSEITGGKLNYDFNAAVPSNDDLEDATILPATLPQTIDADNGLASIQYNEVGTEDWGPRQSLWYSWTPTQDGTVSVDNCSSDVSTETDSLLEIYGDFDPDPGSVNLGYWTGNDDGCPAPNTLLSHAYLAVTSGETYFVRISNYSDDFGNAYKLHIRWVDTPETPRAPYIYPDAQRLKAGDTVNVSPGDWHADPEITEVTVQWKLCDAAGDDCSEIDGATDPSYVVQPSDVGHTFRVAATGTNGVESTTLDSAPSALVDDVPSNDNFADAIDLGSSAPTTVAGDNYYATSEDGENNAAATTVDRSEWYRWTAPQSKTYFVDGCGSSASYRFAANVYDDSGASADQLVRVSVGDVGCSDYEPFARTYFAAQAGSTYFIQVGSGSGQSALDFTLNIHAVPTPEFASAPTLTGDALEGSDLTLHSQAESSALEITDEIFWTLCDSAGDNCTDLPDITTAIAPLTTDMIGKRIRATVTYTNANGSISQSVLSDVIQPDTDGDGVTDDDDTCPTESGNRPNGCPPSEIVGESLPTISGSAVVGQQLTASTGTWSATGDPLGYTLSYQWLRCTSTDAASCSAIGSATNPAYTLTSNELGRFIRVTVIASNADGSTPQDSEATAAVTAAPSGGGTTPPPPAPPTNPLTLTVKKALGNLTPKKGVITIKGAVVSCGASATGPCTGTITFSVKKGSSSTKYIEYPILIPPGKTSPLTIKIKGAKLKAIAKAKSVKATVKISVAAPGFAPSIATATATLKPQKK